MVTQDVVQPKLSSRLANNAEAKSRQVAGSLRYDWVMAILSIWLVGGIHVDGWAHQHVPSLETFFTPWHALFYSGFITIAALLVVTLVGNHAKGYAWTKSLPVGYGLSLIGVAIFMLGGIGDMIWHTLLGIEANVEALFSPTHLTLALGAVLIVSGPVRATWKRVGSPRQSLLNLLPMLLSLTMMLSMLTFFTQYGHPFATTWAAKTFDPNTMRLVEFNQSLAMASTLLQSALLMGIVLLLIRRWALPVGSLTLIFGVNIALLTFMRDHNLTPSIFAFIGIALVTGLVADLLNQWLKPSVVNRQAFRVFAFGVPVLLYALYFLTLVLSGGIWWSVPLWSGGIVLAGVAGLLTSFLVLPPAMPVENGIDQ